MALKTLQNIRYTVKELHTHCADPNACIRKVTDRLHIGLAPGGLARFREAVTLTVQSNKIGRYDARLKGIILDVRNIKVLGNEFPLVNDTPTVHIDLMADIYLFEPRVGAVINGVIKHIAPGHISVTIHRVFNVAIRLSGATKRNLQVNQEIVVRIASFDFTYTIPFIEGELEQPAPPIVTAAVAAAAAAASGTSSTKRIVFDDGGSSNTMDSGISTTEESASRSSKITRKSSLPSSSSSSSSSDEDNDDRNNSHSYLLSKKVCYICCILPSADILKYIFFYFRFRLKRNPFRTM